MSARTSIEWTDVTWNPTRGCSRVSAGCDHCYAMREARRHDHEGGAYESLTRIGKRGVDWSGKVRLVPEVLDEPLRWRKPRRVFVNSMSDLFHESLSNEDIEKVLAVMALATRHTFQVLTKRPARMREWFASGVPGLETREEDVLRAAEWRGKVIFDSRGSDRHRYPPGAGDVSNRRVWPGWPLPNVWLGVSVEDQATADERIPLLLQTPAAVRFVSYEPALGPADLGQSSATCDCCPRWSSRWVRLTERVWPDVPVRGGWASPGIYRAESNRHGALSVRDSTSELLGIKPAEFEALPRLDWVIYGGESGPWARPNSLEWARSARDQCKAAGVAFFMKQAGARPYEDRYHDSPESAGPKLATSIYLRDRKGGDMEEWPADLRVRQFPRGSVA